MAWALRLRRLGGVEHLVAALKVRARVRVCGPELLYSILAETVLACPPVKRCQLFFEVRISGGSALKGRATAVHDR